MNAIQRGAVAVEPFILSHVVVVVVVVEGGIAPTNEGVPFTPSLRGCPSPRAVVFNKTDCELIARIK